MQLSYLLEKRIFKDFEIQSERYNLNKEISTILILETPDFKNYILENGLILTTFYVIKKDKELFLDLLNSLKDHNCPGVCIKLNRYIDFIPEDIIKLSETLDIPIICLNYDANLSELFSTIFSEIQKEVHSANNFNHKLIDFLKIINNNPSTSELIKICTEIEYLDILFYNYETEKIRYTSTTLLDFFNNNYADDTIIIDNKIYVVINISIFENKEYCMILSSNLEKRHILNNYLEIFRILTSIIIQKKHENKLKLNQFIYKFLSEKYNKNDYSSVLNKTKTFNWKLNFPVKLIGLEFSSTSNYNEITNRFAYKILLTISKLYRIDINEIKYFKSNNKIYYIFNQNINIRLNYTKIFKDLISRINTILCDDFSKYLIVETGEITNITEINKHFYNIEKIFKFSKNQNLTKSYFNYSEYEFLSFLSNIDISYDNFLSTVLDPLIEYEKKYKINIIFTAFTYINARFNVSTAAKELFIHYNTLKYRLNIIKNLGFDLSDKNYNYIPLYFACFYYLYLLDKND